MSLKLLPGTTCVADGRVIQIDGPDSLTHMRARDMGTGKFVVVPIARIEALPKQIQQASNASVPEAEWKRCASLVAELLPMNGQLRVSREALAKVAERHGCSLRTVQRARAALQKDPRTSSLVRGRPGRRLGTSVLPARVDAVVRYAIQKYFIKREHPSKAYVILRAQSLARRLGLAPPSRKAVLARIRQEEGWAADTARHGRKAANQKWQPRPGRLMASRPLELIQIDHTPADVILLADDRKNVIGRPWVTLAIDVATRCVVGLYIAMEAPSSVSVSLCIEHAVLPKPENTNNPGMWPMYGKPQRILVDNGKDFRSMALQRGCEEHGIELTWRPVRTPHYGAHIERLNGTLMQIAHLLPGTTFSNPQQRGDYDSAKRARLTLDEFRAWMTRKICLFYHVRKHRGIDMAPLTAWERGLTDDAGVLVPPPLLTRPLEFRMDFLPFAFRKVRRTGIEFGASRYWHEALVPMLNHRDEILLRYDPRSPGQIWIKRDDGVLVTAPAIAGRAADEPGARVTLDAEQRAELDRLLDLGFEATDQIEEAANKATREARGTKRRPKDVFVPPAPDMTGSIPPMRPSSVTPTVEEWL